MDIIDWKAAEAVFGLTREQILCDERNDWHVIARCVIAQYLYGLGLRGTTIAEFMGKKANMISHYIHMDRPIIRMQLRKFKQAMGEE